MIGTELAEHGAADGMTGDHGAVDVELLEYGQQIGSRLVGADAVGADGRISVPTEVVRDDSEAVGEVDELVSPQVVGERQTVDQYEWWTSPGSATWINVRRWTRPCDAPKRVLVPSAQWTRRARSLAAANDPRNRNREADDPGSDDGGSNRAGVVACSPVTGEAVEQEAPEQVATPRARRRWSTR